jgi:putative ABC transport system permease protein
MSLPQTRYADAERTRLFYERLVTTLGGSGRLRAVAIGTSAPFAPGVRASIAMTDRHPPDAGPAANVEQAAEHIVSGEYFQVLSIPVLAGRSFNERDTPSSQGVAIVSRRFARVRWGNMPPLGQTVERGGRSYEVIGVVGDVRGSDTQGLYGGGPDREPRAAVYFASAQLPQRNMTVLVGSNGDPTVVVSALRETIRQLDPALPVQQVRPLRDWWTASVAPTRLTTMLAAIFAASALLLASVGIYGVVAFTVASRTREIGVRMAIGASRGRVMRLVVMDGMRYAGGGILTGLFGAQAAARLIAAFLFEIPARDPATFATVGVAVTVVALVSSTIPALRATRIDPTLAIRTE